MSRDVFITGATGYMGSGLARLLCERGHPVRALVRPGSEHKLYGGAAPVTGNPLDAATFSAKIPPCDTFVQLVGVPHPSPSKAKQFREIDLASVRASVSGAVSAGIKHFIYVSVAHPAPMMHAYIEVRKEGERLIRESGLNATILRPWYVLGPGHRWPYLLIPFYRVFESFPATRESARRLGLVTLRQMLKALAHAVENPARGIRIAGVPEIRKAA